MRISYWSSDVCSSDLMRMSDDSRKHLSDDPRLVVTPEHIQHIRHHLGSPFGQDNRAGLNGQLHRISAVCDKEGGVIGLTMRVGRNFPGNTYILSDLLLHSDFEEKSILVLGPPGAGKTTMIREIGRAHV